ncbi:MAG: rhomboid family intramembrane serine protease [Bacteroidales bacterium]|nr:rhomboid family intramembrane serine protease [Bacteroidales bacterium]
MGDGIRLGSSGILPPVVKNLLIINGLFFLAKIVLANMDIDLDSVLGLHYYAASDFHLWQFFTYMFMHADFGHIFFNMFALWMFGAVVENVWGGRRFLIYYLLTGIGAAMCHYIIVSFQVGPDLALFNTFLDAPSVETYTNLAQNCSTARLKPILENNLQYLLVNPDVASLNELVDVTAEIKDSFLNSYNIIGASGAVFGILLAFGMMFPNSEIYLYFLLPIKAKWFVLAYGVMELVYGVTGTADGVAHFAHLGGMLVGLVIILIWRKKDKNNYYQTYY